MTETFLSYLTLSITKTPVILRMTNGHPYGNMDLLRVWVGFIGKGFGRSKPLPYNKLHLLRVFTTYNI